MQNAKQLADHLRQVGIGNEAVLSAIANVERHRFVPENLQDMAYIDDALPIGANQTISQPFVVARMSELLFGQHPVHKVLEVGTGSGYQAAVLAELVDEVYSIERIESLSMKAKNLLNELGYQNIHLRYGDGYLGWEAHAPYDAIIVTAAAREVPQALLAQLVDGGRMVIPIGDAFFSQEIYLIERHGDVFESMSLDPVMFVPMLPGID